MSIIEVINKLSDAGVYVFVEEGKLKTRSDDNSLTDDIAHLIRSNKSQLIDYLSVEVKADTIAYGKILPLNERKSLLSYAQQRLWLLSEIDGGSAHYNISGVFKLTGALNYNVVNKTFSEIIERHHGLRTRFIADEEGQLFQIIQDSERSEVSVDDLTALEPEAQQQQLNNVITAAKLHTFDLSRDLMIYLKLVKTKEDEHILLVVMHHIVSDGWSTAIFVKEFKELYSAFYVGNASPLPPLHIQYADYASWQHQWLQGDIFEEQLNYWAKELADLPLVHSLPLDYPRPTVQTFTGSTYINRIDLAATDALKELCRTQGATLYMGLHVVFSILLSRYSNERDIVVGSFIANREQEEIANLIGFFVNALVLRMDLTEQPSFNSLLGKSRRTLLDAYKYQQVPFQKIVEKIQPERNMAYSPLFQIMLVLHNYEKTRINLPDLELTEVKLDSSLVTHDLRLDVVECPDGLDLRWSYRTDLFNPSTIERMANHFNELLNVVLKSPDAHVYELNILNQQERFKLLSAVPDELKNYNKNKFIHELFEAREIAQPNAIAIKFEAQELSYRELNSRANRLAHYLVNKRNVMPNTLVGVCVERSLDTIVAILGVLKAGGAYVPIDPDYPESRVKYILDDAKLDTVIIHAHLVPRLPVTPEQALCIDDPYVSNELDNFPSANLTLPENNSREHNLAYVIYTSGSTGNPKGVLVEHHNVTRLFHAAQAHFDFNHTDIWTLFHSYAFDFSVWEIWGALCFGGRLIIVPYWISRSTSDFYQLVAREKVTVLNQTPSAFNQFMPEDSIQNLSLSLRYVIFGGEALNLSSLSSWVARHGDAAPNLINMYGITETTVHVTYRRLTQTDILENTGASLIGAPLSDLQLIVLNEEKSLVPAGVVGELYVGGAGVTRGYLNREELTESRFVSLPGFGNRRFYRTGDLARKLINGEFEYFGRIDQQVKIRGFRIELGEIESVLRQHPSIQDVVVVARDNDHHEKQLVAYIVPASTENMTNTAAPSIDFSLFYFGANPFAEKNKYELYLKAAQFADENGFEAIWTPERHFDPVGGLYPNPAVLNAAIATITQRIQLRAGSVVLPLQDPIRVAEEWSVVDNLSNGRVGMAIASGWHPRDFVLAPDNFAERKKILSEGVKTVRALWAGESITRRDGNNNDVSVKIYPTPAQRHIPLWVAAGGNPETFIEAGRLGVNLITHFLGQSIQDLEQKISLYRESLVKHGHDPKKGRVTLMVHTFLGEDLEHTLEQARTPFIDYMKAHVSLYLVHAPGVTHTQEEIDDVTALAFEHYVSAAALIGTPKSVLPMVERIQKIDVDEIACLIDWMDNDLAFQGLEHINQLKNITLTPTLNIKNLGDYCRNILPPYMLPSAYVALEKLPLTSNGKVNVKELPKPDISLLQEEYVAPRSEVEVLLCEIWQEVLKVERIGITDNLFHLGGHSLLIIQLIAKMKKAGMDVLVKDIMQFPTVAGVAALISQQASTSFYKYNYVKGDTIYSLPNKQMLFKYVFNNHWNQSGILNIIDANPAFLSQALQAVVLDQEGLRHIFHNNNGVIHESVIDIEDCELLQTIDLSNVHCHKSRSEEIERIANEMQHSLDLGRHLFRFVLFNCGNAEPARFLWIVHHALMDGYSFAVFIKELFVRYLSLVQGKAIKDLSVKTSVIEWANYLNHWVNSPDIEKDVKYWQSLEFNRVGRMIDFPDGLAKNRSGKPALYGDDFLVERQLDIQSSDFLLSFPHRADRITAADVIFTGLSNAISLMTKTSHVCFTMISLGREKIIRNVDLSRTIGWFSDYLPVLINADLAVDRKDQVLSYKKQYESIPNGGLAFNAIKAFSKDKELKKYFNEIPIPEFNINYIPPDLVGVKNNIENEFSDLPAHLISLADESYGVSHSEIAADIFWASYIEVAVKNGTYNVKWICRDNIYKKETIEQGVELWVSEINEIIAAFIK
ncbi:MAG TPA: MupA/Atu3671 family FMN-dependent luciferase-like monooxygenase [Cellvibrio sp.]|nr:MupA/Atu3671 family FMN-dependent luciferase-like monooxygenase [Cellvibrio sp.]